MEAAAALKTSFIHQQQGKHAQIMYLHAPPKKFNMLSHSPHLPCRFQAPSATSSTCSSWCKDKRLLTNDGWFSKARTRRSIVECQSSLSCSTTATSLAVAAAASATATTTTTIDTTTTNYNNTHIDSPTPTFTRRREHDEVGVQELTVYEVNERDRDSPVLLFSSKLAVDWYNRLTSLGGLGDLVPFSNKIFDGSLQKRLGITAGIISVIQYYPKESGFLFEAVYSFYFGDFGHISVKGPYKTHKDTILTVTGGSGIFNGVYGTVEIRNIEFPIVLFYTFKLHGIAQLPNELRWKTIPPTKGVRPSRNASLPGIALHNFTD